MVLAMGKRVAIIGMGTSGIEAAKLAYEFYAGEELFLDLYDESDCTAHAEEISQLTKRGARLFSELHSLDDVAALKPGERYDIAVISPGISWHSQLYRSAQRQALCLLGEAEFAWSISQGSWIGITGTNGKSTTTTLVNHILNSCGHSSKMVGNIGYSCSSSALEELKEPNSATEYKVCELSSFQLYTTQNFAPQIGVLLNIEEDHLAWHGSMEHYARSKMRLFSQMRTQDCAVVNADFVLPAEELGELDEGSQALQARFSIYSANRGKSLLRYLEGTEQQNYMLAYEDSSYGALMAQQIGAVAYLDEGYLCFARKAAGELELMRVVQADMLPLSGAHNIENCLAALCVAFDCGLESEDIVRALLSFQGLEHRMEFVAEHKGCRYYNDSKATNPHAALQALTAFPGEELVVLLGGYDKGVALGDFMKSCVTHASCLVCFGSAGKRFYDEAQKAQAACVQTQLKLELADNMAEAFELACQYIASSKVVLLSPACASFDEFSGFEERGRVFKQMVYDAIQKDESCR